MIKKCCTIVPILCCAIFVSVTAHSQITGTIYGTVKDPSGAVLPGATVTAASPNLLRSNVFAVTDEQGRFRIRGLPAGIYTVSVDLSGFDVSTVENIRLDIDANQQVNIVMQLEGVTEAVTVMAETPLVEVKSSSLAEAIKPEVIDMMPLKGRQFLDLVSLVPGTAPAPPEASGQGAGVTVFGERTVTNSFLVDGMENNDDFTRSFAEFYVQDTIQEFKVVIGGYNAEYGRASGGVVNVITKSGSNSIQGRAFLFARDDALNASNVEGQDPPELQRTELGGTLGGPIKSDKAWFFGAAQRVKETRGLNFNLAVVPAIVQDGWFSPTPGGENFGAAPDLQHNTFFGKVNHEFDSSNNLFATININLLENLNVIPARDRMELPGPPGSVALPSIASNVETNSYSATGRYTKFFGTSAFLESSFRYVRNRFQENAEKEPGAETIAGGTFTPQGTQFWLANAANAPGADRKLERYQWAEGLSLFKSTTDWGTHDLKLGMDVNWIKLDRNFVPVYTMIVANTMYEGNYQDLDIGTVEMQRGVTAFTDNRTRTEASNTNIATYGQDTWEIRPGLTINAGLRYDYSTLFNEDKNNLSPRIGFAWDPNNDGATVIRGSFGIYFDQNILDLAVRIPELGGIEPAEYSFQSIPRGASTYNNPQIGANGPLQAGGTRWLANPAFFSAILPEGLTLTSGNISVTGQGRPFVVYELLGIPVDDPVNPPLLEYDSIAELTGGRLTPEEAVQIINDAFPGAECDQFAWDETPPPGSIIGDNRYLIFKFRQCGPSVDRRATLEHP